MPDLWSHAVLRLLGCSTSVQHALDDAGLLQAAAHHQQHSRHAPHLQHGMADEACGGPCAYVSHTEVVAKHMA